MAICSLAEANHQKSYHDGLICYAYSFFAATTQSSQTNIPFWLQILSIALAPLLGFAGVAIGIGLNGRNSRSAYVKEQRRKVYVDYLEVMSRITAFVSFEHPVKSGLEGVEESEAFADKAAVLVEQLERAYMCLSVIGSPEACEAAVEAFTYLDLASGLAKAMLRGKPVGAGWSMLHGLALFRLKLLS